MRADLIAAGDQEGKKDLIYAATAVACGQDIEVPDLMLYKTLLLSPFIPERGAAGDHAARIPTPGAVISGCNIITRFVKKLYKTYLYIIRIHISALCANTLFLP